MTQLVLIEEFLNTLDARSFIRRGIRFVGTDALDTPVASAKKCPGYKKNASSNPTAESLTAVVTSNTEDGLALPGVAKGAICIASDGSVSALKRLLAK